MTPQAPTHAPSPPPDPLSARSPHARAPRHNALSARTPRVCDPRRIIQEPLQAWQPKSYSFPHYFAKDLTPDNFGAMVGFSSHKYMVVNFYVPFSPHCQSFAARFEKLAQTFNKQVRSFPLLAPVAPRPGLAPSSWSPPPLAPPPAPAPAPLARPGQPALSAPPWRRNRRWL